MVVLVTIFRMVPPKIDSTYKKASYRTLIHIRLLLKYLAVARGLYYNDIVQSNLWRHALVLERHWDKAVLVTIFSVMSPEIDSICTRKR